MHPAHIFRRCSVPLVLALASLAGAGARAVELTSSSPFLPPNTPDSSATPANSPLELHGIVEMPDGYKFNLCDPSGHINVWIGLNAAGQPFVVRTHDVAHNRVTVEYQGRELTLSLPQPKIAPMSMQPQSMMMPQPQMVMGQAPMQPGMVNSSPQDDRLRLERIAEEIRRRRALRAGLQAQPPYGPGPNQPGMYQPPQPPPQ
jgi:hypothetical protein